MPATNPKNITTNAAASDLGLGAAAVDQSALDVDNERKKKLLAQQMGGGSSVYGNASMSLFSELGNG